MKRKLLFGLLIFTIHFNVQSQYIYPIHEYSASLKDITLNNFDIQDSVLFLPLGEQGLHLLNIKDLNNIYELSEYIEYEKRSHKHKVYGFAHHVKVIGGLAYLSYGPLGLKILDVNDPTMPFVLGGYYRHEDVVCTEIYENFAFLGYYDMGLEIADISEMNNTSMASRNNVRGFTVKNIQIVPPYVVISGGESGLRIFKFQEPFTSFKQAEFPKEYLTKDEANKIILQDKVAFLANSDRGLSVLNMGLPLYPLEINNIKTEGKAIDLIIDGEFLYISCEKSIEVFNIQDPENPQKTYEHLDKDKDFVSLEMYDNKLFALYSSGKNDYGLVIFQVE